MRSAPTAACHIDADIMPLRLRRDKAVLEMTERYRRMEENNPNHKLVIDWKANNRIKQKSILKVESNLQNKHNLPTIREKESSYSDIQPPNRYLEKAKVNLNINSTDSKRTMDPTTLKIAGLNAIQSFPDEWTHIYTDGSASKGTKNAGFGVRIEYPDKTCKEISKPCGALCSNFDAEASAIQSALQETKSTYLSTNKICSNIVIFTDARSVLQALENKNNCHPIIEKLNNSISDMITTFSVEITLQWIPSHCEIPGNEAADILAKKGAQLEQPNTAVSLNTCKQVIKEKMKTEWLKNWADSTTGRPLYDHLKEPNPKDPINTLGRREQVIIYRLRTQHVQLNAHLNRIKTDHLSRCPLCHNPNETVCHFLFECQNLKDLRQLYLPPEPDLGNTLYSSREQLESTTTYFILANRRRANAHMTAGSVK